MKWNNLGTYTWNSLGTWTWDTLDNFTNGYEQVFSTRDTVSANYLAELAKLTGASPHYKVFIEDANGTIDLEFASFERIVTTPEVSRSLERLFQETQISSIGVNVDNTDDYFNPMGTGLFAVSSVYNKPIKVWKGFKYGWTGSSWGTAEYIPAFTGYIDNIQQDSQGRAVINARDKGKLFQNNTSEKTTQTGTAGGAYWNNERIDENVEHLLLQSVGYGNVNTDYVINPTYLISATDTREISTIGNDVVIDNLLVVGTSVYVSNNSGIYAYSGKGTASFIGTFNNGTVTDGTFIYNSALYRYDPTTNSGTAILGTNSVSALNMVYMRANNSLYFTGGTNIYFANTIGGTIGTIETAVYSYPDFMLALYNDEQAVSNGTHLFVLNGGADLGEYKGTYNVKAISLISNAHYGDGQIILNSTNIPGTTARLSTVRGFNRGTIFMETNIFPGGFVYGGHDTGTAFNVEYALAGNFAVSSGAIYNGGTSFIKRKYYSILDDKLYYTSGGTLWSLVGTTNTMIDTTSVSNSVDTSFMGEIGTTDLPKRLFLFNKSSGTVFEQYSSMYFFTIGTFDVGNGDKVSDVLQTLAEASNYVQYIDEGGVYYFRRRDSGTTIDYTFGTNDIVALNIVEGEGVSQSPIINKGIWGTNTGTVSYEDLPSQGTYGLQSYSLNNKWITSPAVANDVLYGLVNDNKQPKTVITAKLRYYPVIKLFDVCGLDYSRLNLSGTKPWQVIGLSEGNQNTTLTLKEV